MGSIWLPEAPAPVLGVDALLCV